MPFARFFTHGSHKTVSSAIEACLAIMGSALPCSLRIAGRQAESSLSSARMSAKGGGALMGLSSAVARYQTRERRTGRENAHYTTPEVNKRKSYSLKCMQLWEQAECKARTSRSSRSSPLFTWVRRDARDELQGVEQQHIVPLAERLHRLLGRRSRQDSALP